ncbi:unnamed protein product [Didymodactylos carnosus]|uniref:Uncharacterized protein n=1 Tax=Didymodactylos carnosus TaxID=1234261 RepID=A0A8S2DVK3_9BILA|nr:unnamed protein product [Didymodactylos carnosus]CAF3763767.1 unnamed protein product [Didymodactylos carnosus]CAF4663170.1 unnamed protein product [Didymodactylos carnosus]
MLEARYTYKIPPPSFKCFDLTVRTHNDTSILAMAAPKLLEWGHCRDEVEVNSMFDRLKELGIYRYQNGNERGI